MTAIISPDWDQVRPIGDGVRVAWSELAGLTVTELEQALNDFEWRVTHLYFIMDKDGNEVRFAPNVVQWKFIREIWFRNLVPKARQRGFSTLIQILMLDAALFEKNMRGAIIAQSEPIALRIFRDKIRYAYDRLPPTIREMQPLTTDSKTELMLGGNNSSLSVATSTRGGTLQWLHVSEYGKICAQSPERADEIQTGSLPSVAPSGIAVIESTIEGIDGIFSDMCKKAKARAELGTPLLPQEYRLHFASWWDASEYEADPEGVIIRSTDAAMFMRMEAAIGQEISARKRAWYVLTRDVEFSGDQEKMWKQYPTTIEEAFTISTEGAWLGDVLSQARVERRVGQVPYNPSLPVNFFWDLGIEDDIAIWCHQFDGTWDNFIDYYECSNVPYSVPVGALQQKGFHVWGQTFLPHDGAKRTPGAMALKTSEDMIRELHVRNIEIVPVTPELVVGNNLMRNAFYRYRFDEVKCAEGLLHLAGYKKPWIQRHSIFGSGYVKNGHQHAADALRQHAQAQDAEMIQAGGSSRNKVHRKHRSGRTA